MNKGWHPRTDRKLCRMIIILSHPDTLTCQLPDSASYQSAPEAIPPPARTFLRVPQPWDAEDVVPSQEERAQHRTDKAPKGIAHRSVRKKNEIVH